MIFSNLLRLLSFVNVTFCSFCCLKHSRSSAKNSKVESILDKPLSECVKTVKLLTDELILEILSSMFCDADDRSITEVDFNILFSKLGCKNSSIVSELSSGFDDLRNKNGLLNFDCLKSFELKSSNRFE